MVGTPSTTSRSPRPSPVADKTKIRVEIGSFTVFRPSHLVVKTVVTILPVGKLIPSCLEIDSLLHSYRGDVQQGATPAHAAEQQSVQDGKPARGPPQADRGQLYIEVGGGKDGALQLCA